MKIFFLILLILNSAFVMARNYTPNYVNETTYYGIGVLHLNEKTNIYEKNDANSKIVAEIDKDKIKIPGFLKTEIEDTYILYSSDDNIALLPVGKDTDEWYYICYNQKNKLFGWVKKNENTDFMTYQDFYNIYGRKRGLYLFRNVLPKYKKLYSAPNIESTLVDEFYIARHISLWLISGDWALVKVTTYDNVTKTGWIRWKNDNGSIMIFPDFRDIEI